MKTHECISFIMLDGNKILLEKRRKDKETDPGLITIPGGHIEDGETQVQALM
ncbi:NUDIX domain-containing protein, partial [Vibrio fortis]